MIDSTGFGNSRAHPACLPAVFGDGELAMLTSMLTFASAEADSIRDGGERH